MRRLILGLLMLVGVIGATSYARAQEREAAMDAVFDSILDQAIGDMMTPGPKLEGWEQAGADIFAALEKAPGGNAGSVLLTEDPASPNSVTFMDAGFADIAIPPEWQIVKQRPGTPPALEPGQRRSIFFAPVDGPYYLVSESRVFTMGTAVCARGLGHTRIYRLPGRAGGELPDMMALKMFDRLERALEGKLMCEIYEPLEAGYRVRPVTGEGLTMPKMDTESTEVTRIVPRAPIETLLFPAAAK